MRRGIDDLKWQEVKEKIRKRDKKCQCCSALTTTEYILSNKIKQKYGGNQLDCAHIEPVSICPEKVYDLSNIVLLCRAHHYMMDNYIDPVTGKRMSVEDQKKWWSRIEKGTIKIK